MQVIFHALTLNKELDMNVILHSPWIAHQARYLVKNMQKKFQEIIEK